MSELDTILFTLGDFPITLGRRWSPTLVVFAILIGVLFGWPNRAPLKLRLWHGRPPKNCANFQEQVVARDTRIRDLELQIERERERTEDQLGHERERIPSFRASWRMRTRLDEQARQNEANLKRFLKRASR